MSKKVVHGTWLSICVALTGGFEGCREYAYRDPVGIPTVCFGETAGVKLGDHYTHAQCEDMLAGRLPNYDAGVSSCVHAPMSEARRAAVVSFTYNVGIAAFCHSAFAQRLNDNDPHACDELLKWTTAHKVIAGRRVAITLPGLVNRRNKEHEYCEAT